MFLVENGAYVYHRRLMLFQNYHEVELALGIIYYTYYYVEVRMALLNVYTQITRYKGSIDTLAGEVARVCAELARVQEENRTMKKETASAKSSPPASLPTPSCETAQLSTEQLYTKLQGDYDTVRHDNDVRNSPK